MTKIKKPANTKSLFATLCSVIEQIENDDMPVEKAAEINNTVNTAVKLLDYELKRSAAMCNQEFRMRHRNLELKGFDSIPEPIRALPENAGG